MDSSTSGDVGLGVEMHSSNQEYRGPIIMQMALMDYHQLTRTTDISDIIMGQSVSRAERFWQACAYGHYVLVKRLLDEGDVDVNWISNIHGCSSIHVAAQGNPQVVQLLISAGCDVNAGDPNGNVALHHATMAGDDEVVQILLSSGVPVNVNQQNRYGWSPLTNACYYGHARCVRLLLDRSADVHLRNKDGRTCLLELCRSRCTLRTQNGHSHTNVNVNDAQSLENVNETQTEPETKSDSNRHADARQHTSRANSGNPLNRPTDQPCSKETELALIAEMLLNAGANADERAVFTSRNGESRDVDADFTPLMFACYHKHYALAKVLLERGADVNACDENGWTALHWATERDNRDIVCLLLSYKCDPRAKDRREQMALDRARSAQLRALLHSASQCSNGYVTTDDEVDDNDSDDEQRESDCDCDAAEWSAGEQHSATCSHFRIKYEAANTISTYTDDSACTMSSLTLANGDSFNALCPPQPRFARAETAGSIDSIQFEGTDAVEHEDAFK